MDKINIGLIGFGTVGSGVVKVLRENSALIKKRLGVELFLKRIADKDTTRQREVSPGPDVIFTADANDVINDPEIRVVVELVGGTGIAKTFILSALDKGKHVVTANKALLSSSGDEIFKRAREKGLDVGFEASVGGGIPVIKALREGLSANNIDAVYGIINGTANYILTEMTDKGAEFGDVLREAQAKGYAEADPSYDIDGIDTAHKLAILASIAYGARVRLQDIYTEGIRDITPLDIKFAGELGYRIKLLAVAKRRGTGAEVRVHPTMVPAAHPLASVSGVYNAVFIHGDAVGSTMFYGRGAGMMPTASAVVADIMDMARDMRRGVSRRISPLSFTDDAADSLRIKDMADLETPYYIRFGAIDRPGVLSVISGVLGAHDISISSVMQKGRSAGSVVPLVMATHTAREKELRGALMEIEKLDVVQGRIIYLRIEESLGAAD